MVVMEVHSSLYYHHSRCVVPKPLHWGLLFQLGGPTTAEGVFMVGRARTYGMGAVSATDGLSEGEGVRRGGSDGCSSPGMP